MAVKDVARAAVAVAAIGDAEHVAIVGHPELEVASEVQDVRGMGGSSVGCSRGARGGKVNPRRLPAVAGLGVWLYVRFRAIQCNMYPTMSHCKGESRNVSP